MHGLSLMQAMSTPTQEQLDKQASENAPTRKKQGFIHHLKAAGCSDETVAARLKDYERLDAHRTQKVDDMREAILGHK